MSNFGRTSNIKEEVFHYEARILPVLGSAEVMGRLKSKYAKTDVISMQLVTINGIYSSVTRIVMKKHIIEEIKILCKVRQANFHVTAKTNLWVDFPPGVFLQLQ